jgi:hypothetical protein
MFPHCFSFFPLMATLLFLRGLALKTRGRFSPSGPRALKHSIRVRGVARDHLQYVPVLHNLTLFVQAENIYPCPKMVVRPVLPTVQDHIIALSDHSLELHALAGIFAGGFLKIGDESLFAVSHARIVLDIGCPGIPLDGLAGATFIEHEVVERHHVPLVAFQDIDHGTTMLETLCLSTSPKLKNLLVEQHKIARLIFVKNILPLIARTI